MLPLLLWGHILLLAVLAGCLPAFSAAALRLAQHAHQPAYQLACLILLILLPCTHSPSTFVSCAGIARYERMFGTGFISPGGKQAHQVGGQVDGGQYHSVPR